MTQDRSDVTRILNEVTQNDENQGRELLAMVYEDLRILAKTQLRGQRQGHTLQATALVNEAYLRLVDRTGIAWKDKSHFFALSGVIMRGILADYARARRTQKRGGQWQRITLSNLDAGQKEDGLDMLALDEALSELAKVSERQSRVVEYRYFGGLTVEEVADLLEVSRSTVEDDWRIAKAWLAMRLSGEHST